MSSKSNPSILEIFIRSGERPSTAAEQGAKDVDARHHLLRASSPHSMYFFKFLAPSYELSSSDDIQVDACKTRPLTSGCRYSPSGDKIRSHGEHQALAANDGFTNRDTFETRARRGREMHERGWSQSTLQTQDGTFDGIGSSSVQNHAQGVNTLPATASSDSFGLHRVLPRRLWTADSQRNDDAPHAPLRSVISRLTDEDHYLSESWRSRLCLAEFISADIWRAATIEGIGMMLYTWASAGSIISANASGYAHPQLVVAVIHAFLIGFLIVGMIPASGGHFSSLITATCFTTKLISLPRAIVYMLMQCGGGILGALLLLPSVESRGSLPVCGFKPNVAISAVLVNELMASWLVVFLVWSCVIDTRQGRLVWVGGGIGGPMVVGAISAMIILISGGGGLAAGLGGAGFNPARCLGIAVAAGEYSGLWVYLLAPLLAAFLQGVLYLHIPPHHEHYYRLRRSRRRQRDTEQRRVEEIGLGGCSKGYVVEVED